MANPPIRFNPVTTSTGTGLGWVISILISIQKFHRLFSNDAGHIPFLSEENKDKKYYKETDISPSMAIVLSQLFHYNLNPSIKNLYYKGKGYELLSLYFNRSEDPNAEQCPFLIDEENVLLYINI